MKIKEILFVASIVVLCGCVNSGKIDRCSDFVELSIEGEIVNSEVLASSPKIFCLDSFLLITDYINAPILRVYREDEQDPILTYGAKGRSKTEFISPMVTSVLGDTIIINDFSKKTISVLVFDKKRMTIEELDNYSYTRKSSDNPRYLPSDFMISRLANGSYVGLSLSGYDKLFSYYDSSLNFINEFGDLPRIKDASAYSIKNNMQGDFKSFNNVIVYASYRIPYVAVYSSDGATIKKSWEDEIYPLELTVVGSDIMFDKDRAKGMFLTITISQNYIYLLFDDSNLESIEKKGSNTILIYDYSGKRCVKLQTEHNLSSISVDKDDSTLYGIENRHSMIIRYDIGKLNIF